MNGTAGRDGTREFALEKAVDANPATAWSPAGDKRHPTIEIDMEGPVDINALAIEEAPDAAGRIKEYKVEAQVDSDWTELAHGTAVGTHHIDRFPKVTAWKVRLTILKSDGEPAVRKFGLYRAD